MVPFLRALERTGEVRAAAGDAGIDHSTAYARRRSHGDFAGAWERALAGHGDAKKRAEEEAIAELTNSSSPRARPSPSHGSAVGPSLSLEGRGAGAGGGETTVSGGQVKRVGHGRWSEAKEAIFFDELAATANIKRSAAAAGVSYNAVLARRQKHALFRAKWDAVVQNAKAAIDLYLVEEAKKTFDPDELDSGEVTPRVTIDQAIRISQSGGSKKAAAADPFDDPDYDYDADIASIREGLVGKLQAMRRRERPELLARGWSYDESWDREIPPGWAKTAEWRPMEDADKYW